MYRFTDIEPTSKRLTPVYGYQTHPLLPLEIALEPLFSRIDQLDGFSKIAKNECHFPSEHGLTRDESAAVFLYTMEWGDNSLYRVINRALRVEDRSTLKPWFAYLKLFDTAVQKLPPVRQNLWRGITGNAAKNFKKGDELTWWSISSCSTSVNAIKGFLESNYTLFLIEAVNGKDMSDYTNFRNEDEVILCLGTRLRVVSDPLDQPPMYLVHLQEMTHDNNKVQLSSSLKMMTVSDPSTTKSDQPGVASHPSTTVQTHNDQWQNRYEGEGKDGTKHGKSKLQSANGSLHTGDWIEGKRAGQAVYMSANGDRYEGKWKDNKRHGKGQQDSANGDIYSGDYIEGNRTGQGVYMSANGDRYEGTWKDNKRHGKGQQNWANGDIYSGDYIEGNRTGQGVYMSANGDRYEGQFKDNKEHGKGREDWADGDFYTGDYVEGNRTGQGIYMSAKGDRYEGKWKDNKRHGKGQQNWANGDIYSGDYIEGNRTGQGIYMSANGDRYEGKWKDNKRHGKGQQNWANGDIYSGDYIEGNRTGQGVYMSANGDRYEL